MRNKKAPKMLPNPLPINQQGIAYPVGYRISFDDGTTQIYDLRIQQPHPIVKRNLEIIRNMMIGYARKEEET